MVRLGAVLAEPRLLSEPLLVVVRIARALDAIGVRYLVGGSLASSIYGIPRATQDVDLVADIQDRPVATLVQDLAASRIRSAST